MTNVVLVSLGYSVKDDLLTSQIRTGTDITSDLVVEWAVEFVNDGSDGQLRLTVDDAVPVDPSVEFGYMDMKRVIGGEGGEPVPVFSGPILVTFLDVVTE